MLPCPRSGEIFPEEMLYLRKGIHAAFCLEHPGLGTLVQGADAQLRWAVRLWDQVIRTPREIAPTPKRGPRIVLRKDKPPFIPINTPHTCLPVFLRKAQIRRQLLYQYQEFSPWLNILPVLQFMSLKGKFNMKTPVKVKAESNDVYLFLFYAANTQPLKGNYAIFKKKKQQQQRNATLKFLSSECYVCTSWLSRLTINFQFQMANSNCPSGAPRLSCLLRAGTEGRCSQW